ncbi:MAG: tRNA (cytidine(56)-2'-O)-methyltransferase [Candidatus Marsarchaeota archaeon]|nr:tRNA (cytidine(56)-2'-O)-methyltransferase [Candidatus Marsarchaeota archaeon]
MISVLRLNHRKRDKRITTHCALTARAFGASGMIFTGEADPHIIESVEKVTEKWGGNFKIKHSKNWKKEIKNKKLKVHLTFYGERLEDKIKELKGKNLQVIIGGEKVPREVYEKADYNISIGSQPHSEVAALAVFLYEYNNHKMPENFKNWKIKITPSKKSKKIKTKQ